jgi:hypothetical protein
VVVCWKKETHHVHTDTQRIDDACAVLPASGGVVTESLRPDGVDRADRAPVFTWGKKL